VPWSDADLRRFRRNAADARRAVTRLEKSTIRQLRYDLREVRARLLQRLAIYSARGPLPTGEIQSDFGAANQLTLLRAVDEAADEAERALSRNVNVAQRSSVKVAVDSIGRALEAQGVTPFATDAAVAYGPLIVAQGEQVAELVVGVSQQFRADLRRSLRLALAGEMDLREFEERIGRALPGPGPFGSIERRAEVIARTETSRTFEIAKDAQLERLDEAGFKFKKQWLTARDDRVRPSHAALDGVIIEQGETFDVGGYEAEHPLDPALPPEESINCRCVLVTIFEEAKEPAGALSPPRVTVSVT
jgi:hypothetical protein